MRLRAGTRVRVHSNPNPNAAPCDAKGLSSPLVRQTLPRERRAPVTSMTMRAAQQCSFATAFDMLARPRQWGAHTPTPPHSRLQFGSGPEVALGAVLVLLLHPLQKRKRL
jgi:hypothetical protein